jgi:hypothetical protein
VGEAAQKDDDEKLIPVGPGAEGLPEAEEKDEREQDDKRLAQKDDDELEQEKPAERRKESAKERRERAKKAHARDRTERDFLLKRNEELEKQVAAIDRRQSQSETAAIDQRINAINAQLSNADRVIAEALRKPNGAGVDEFVEAQRIRDQLRDQLSELTTARKSHQQQSAQRSTPRDQETRSPDQRVVRNARKWASDNDWFDFSGTDEDSAIVRALDQSLSDEGWNPATEEYWEELTDRVKRRLPERFKKAAARTDDDAGDDTDDDEEAVPRRSGGPKFSAGGRERPLKKGEVYVSPERKRAMQEYGVWNDPVLRNRMLKKYAQWDADNASKS